ncbi:MAG: hypothetical protein HQL56_15150 [Magnetococcales bacterium]|nr:hypothetical protein [Magnetococcales bacterium]
MIHNKASITELQLGSLLRLIDEQRQKRCEEMLQEARRQADEIVRRAHREARGRMRQAVGVERALMLRTVERAKSRMEAENRRRHLRQTTKMLSQARSLLEEAMRRRWADPVSRLAWLAMVVQTAKRHLPAEAVWLCQHPPGFDAGELTASFGAVRWSNEPDETLTAGVRVGLGQTWIDGSLESILGDRQAMEARLLDLLDQATGESP